MSSDRIEGVIRNGAGRLEAGVGALTGDDALIAKGRLNETAGFVQDLVGQAKDQFADVMASAKDRASEPLDAVRGLVVSTIDRNEDRLNEIKALVARNPLAAIGVAAAVGIFMGLFLKRARPAAG